MNEIYVNKLIKMINSRTVFKIDGSNAEEYKKFNEVLSENFPLLHQKANKLIFGSGCIVYELKGKNAKRNIMLMSHHDVVDKTDGWVTNPFNAVIKDGYLYGRGTIDTKTPLFGELQAIEEILNEDTLLDNINLYIGSSNNEEVSGDGMVEAVKYFKKHNIHFDIVLDEGGAIMQGMIPGYSGKSAMVAVHEKSRHIYECVTTRKTKGHGGLVSDDDSPLERMSEFINRVNHTKIYKNKFYPEVKANFSSHVPYMKYPMKLVFKYLDVFSPIVKKIMANMPAAKAMLNTSVIFTTFNAGDENNPQIRAKDARCHMFIRCIREEDLEEGLLKIKEIAKKYDVEINLVERDYCRPTDFNSDEFRLIKKVLNKNFKDIVVAPFLLTAGTDARRFSDIADNIFRFAPIDLNNEQFKSIHGDNECIKVENIEECVRFYKDYIIALNKEV